RLMFMECPHRSENGLAQGFGNYDLKRRCFKAIWRTRSAFGSPMFQALRLPKKSLALKSSRCSLRDWTYRSEKYSGICDSGSVEVIHFGNQLLVFQRLSRNQSLDRIAEQVRIFAVVEPEAHFIAVGLQVLGADLVPCADDPPFQKRECRLDSVCVNV